MEFKINNFELWLITGGSGSGKTTVGEFIRNSAKDIVQFIDLDNFYKEEKDPQNANFDLPKQYDWERLKLCLTILNYGHYIHHPEYDFTIHRPSDKQYIKYESKPVVLLVGNHAAYDKEISKFASKKIFIDASDKIRYGRRLERDIAQRGRTPESVKQQYDTQVRPAYEEYIEPIKYKEDVTIITNEGNFITELQENEIIKQLKKELNEMENKMKN